MKECTIRKIIYLFFKLIAEDEKRKRDNKLFKNELKDIAFKRIFNTSLFEFSFKKINLFLSELKFNIARV